MKHLTTAGTAGRGTPANDKARSTPHAEGLRDNVNKQADSNQFNLVLTTTTAEARVDSRTLAQHLHIKHQHLFEQIKDYRSDFEQLGKVRFETEASPDSRTGQQGDVRGTEPSGVTNGIYGDFSGRVASAARNDAGSAARFFYCAKASSDDRHDGCEHPGAQFKSGTTLRDVENTKTRGNNHPTVKPTDLMRYLCRLVTPAGGIVLDPFMGSGSTGRAAVLEGFQYIGMERDAAYIEIARARIDSAKRQGHQPSFDFAEAA